MRATICLLFLLATTVLFAQSVAKNESVGALSYRLHHVKYFNYSGTQPELSDTTLYTYSSAGVGDEDGHTASEEHQVLWNNTSQIFEEGYKTLQEFNGSGKITKRTYVEWDGTQWLNTKKTEWAYDGSDNQIQNSNFTWRNNAWYEFTRSTNTFNGQNKVVFSMYQDTSSGVLADKSKTVFTYDANDREINFVQQNKVSGVWENNYKQEYFYTGTSTNSDSILSSYWNNSAWGLVVKIAYIYNANGNIQERYRYDYNANTWVNNSKEVYAFNSNWLMSQYDVFMWVSNAWRNTYRGNYLYSGTGKEIKSVYKQYSNTTQQLENTSQYYTTYNTDDLKSVLTSYSWSTNSFKPSTRKEYYYEQHQPTGIEELKNNNHAIAFPNPFLVNTIIQFSTANSGDALMGIFDVSGRQVFSQKLFVAAGENSLLWDGTDKNGNLLPSGLYMVKVTKGEQTFSTRIVKQ